MAQIVSIAYSPPTGEPRPSDRYHREPFQSAVLVVDRGFEADRKSKGGDRQINIMSAETLAGLAREGFKTGPGEMGEQIAVGGIEIDSLPLGARLRLGASAVVEVTSARSGCDRFEHIQGKLKKLVRGRLGVMARVVGGGPIAVGDVVTLLVVPPSGGCASQPPEGGITNDINRNS
jgi:MOSC domain-containing protein YiiM